MQLPWQEVQHVVCALQMPWQDMETQENVHEAAVYHAVLSGERLEFPPLDSIEPPCPHIKRVSLCWLRFLGPSST